MFGQVVGVISVGRPEGGTVMYGGHDKGHAVGICRQDWCGKAGVVKLSIGDSSLTFWPFDRK